MPALMATFGATTEPFKKEMLAAQRLAEVAGRNIGRSFSSGGAVSDIHISGAPIRHTLMAMRELASGDLMHLPSTFVRLASHFGLLNLLFKDNASATHVLAGAYAKLAADQSLAAIAATRKAAASMAALYEEGGETEATLAAAAADEQKAIAARTAAAATAQKAESSAAAAATAQVEAGSTKLAVGALGMVVGVLAAIGLGAYNAYWLTGKLVERLSGLKFPEFHPEYIARHLQATNQTTEAWKQISKEVDRTVDSYYSAAKAAERLADTTKRWFDHQRKMAEYNKQIELNKATSPEQKRAIERKYAEEELARNARERETELRHEKDKIARLEQEGKLKMEQADQIKVSSKEHDANTIAAQKQRAEAAQKYLDDLKKESVEGTSWTDKVVSTYNAVALSGVSGKDLADARKRNESDARAQIKRYQDMVDSTAANDELRERKKELQKQAGESYTKAAAAREGLPEMEKKMVTANRNEREEMEAKLAAERGGKKRTLKGELTANQRVGAYAAPASVALIDPIRKSENHLRIIKDHLLRNPQNTRSRPQLGHTGF